MGSNINFPKVSVPIISATVPQENSDQKVLFLGVSPAAAGLYQNIGNSEATINATFTQGSQLARMLVSAREINDVCEFDVISVEEAGGSVEASATIQFVTATEDYTLVITVESAEVGVVTIFVTTGDTGSEIATAVEDAVNAKDEIDFLATTSTDTVTITYGLGGAFGNLLGIEVLDPTLSSTLVGFKTTGSGSGLPDYTGLLDLIGEERYQTIVSGLNDSANVNIVKDFLDSRFNSGDSILDGVCVVGYQDTFANISIYGLAFNSQSLVVIGDSFATGTTINSSFENSAISESPWIVAARFGAVRALRRQQGANIANLIIGKNGALDTQGGPALSSKPYANTPFPNLPIVPVSRGFTRQEIGSLNDDGVSVLGNNRNNTSVICGQITTTYKTDAAANPDVSFKFLNYVDTASTGREYIFNNLQSTYAQSRLTDGNLVKGRDMANKESISATMVGFFQVLSGEDFVVARKGEDILQFFKENLDVSIDLAQGAVTTSFNLPIVTQLREIYAPMTLTFNIE